MANYIGPIGFMRVESGDLIYPEHLNGSPNFPAGSWPYGLGLQDTMDILLSAHHHVHPVLFESKFGDYARIRHPHNLWPLSTAINSIHGYTGSFYNSGSVATFLGLSTTQSRYAAFFLLWCSYWSPNTGNGVPYSLLYTTELGDSTFSLYSPADFLGSNFASDTRANHRFYWTGIPPVVSTGDLYGFFNNALFVGPIWPKGIQLTNDVNPLNDTFEKHLKDVSIHIQRVVPPSPTSDSDHMLTFWGTLNLYDLADQNIDHNTRQRANNDYPLDMFDQTFNDLDKLNNPNKDIRHPMLYEEGVFFAHNRKVRQFKTMKAYPDDFALVEKRKTLDPLESLFVGGATGTMDQKSVFKSSIVDTDGRDRYIECPNTVLDTYWYENFYLYGENREWLGGTGGTRHLEFLMHEGLGYMPNSGFATGV